MTDPELLPLSEAWAEAHHLEQWQYFSELQLLLPPMPSVPDDRG